MTLAIHTPSHLDYGVMDPEEALPRRGRPILHLSCPCVNKFCLSVYVGGYATFCILLAKSRPEVGGGRGFPSFR